MRRREPVSKNTTVFYGVEALHESIVSNNLGDHARSRGAAYAAVDFRALKRFSLTISAREEVYRRLSAEFSPTVAGGFWISPSLKLRASASRAFRVPSYTDLYYHDPGNRGQSEPASRAGVDLRRRRWTGARPARSRASSPSSSGASATASITSARRPPTSGAP